MESQSELASASLSKVRSNLFQSALDSLNNASPNSAQDTLSHLLNNTEKTAEDYYQLALQLMEHNYYEYALIYLKKARELQPDYHDVCFRLGCCYEYLNEFDQAIDCYLSILEHIPEHQQSLAKISFLYYQQLELERAKQRTIQWIQTEPTNANAYNLLGCISMKEQAYQQAIFQFKQALQFDVSLIEAIINLSQAYMTIHDFHEASHHLQRALLLDDTSSIAHTYYGITLLNQRKIKMAEHHFKKAIHFDANNALAYANLAVSLQQQFYFGSANQNMRQALSLSNTEPKFYTHFANNLLLQKHPKKAAQSCHRALHLNETTDQVKRLLGEAKLSMGQYQDAWQEWRAPYQNIAQGKEAYMNSPCWDGSRFPGKLLLIYCDTPIEETILLLRYLLLVKQRGRRIMIACSFKLIGLFEQIPFLETVSLIEADKPSMQADLHVPLSLLPEIFATTLDTIPNQFPYLPISNEQQQIWQNFIKHASQRRYNIGLAWDLASKTNLSKHIPFRFFSHCVLTLKNAHFFSLTAHQSEKQMRFLSENQVEDIGTSDINTLIAMIDQLDLIITSDNIVAHLAGALGKPVWVILPFAAKWYWLWDPDHKHAYWYPHVILFRQTQPNRWHPLMTCILQQLKLQYGDVDVAD